VDENDIGDEPLLVAKGGASGKRSVTDNMLSAQQQMLVGAKLRTLYNNASPQRCGKRTASYQYTKTTTTTATISSSPPVPLEEIAPLRRSTRITSAGGVRKVSGSARRK
jgi:hypothetical protein